MSSKKRKRTGNNDKNEDNTSSLLDSEQISVTAFKEYMRSKQYSRERNRSIQESHVLYFDKNV